MRAEEEEIKEKMERGGAITLKEVIGKEEEEEEEAIEKEKEEEDEEVTIGMSAASKTAPA